jgi:hypothetical protein
MKEIVRVMQVAHAQELREFDVSEWPLDTDNTSEWRSE